MDSQRYQIKLYVQDPAAFELEPFMGIFHGWIQNGTLEDELTIDVADYSHVPGGPGVVLIGHGTDYYIDYEGGRPGLLYSRKRNLEGDVRQHLADAFRRTVRAARLIEGEESLGDTVRFGTGEIVVRIPDRLHAPNTERTFEAFRPELERFLERLYAGGRFEVTREGDERRPFTVRVRADDGPDLETAAARIEASKAA